MSLCIIVPVDPGFSSTLGNFLDFLSPVVLTTIMLIGKYDRFFTNDYHIRSIRSPMYPYVKRYDSSVKIDNM